MDRPLPRSRPGLNGGESFQDPLLAEDEVDERSLFDEIAREGARRMLLAALETEVAAYVEGHGAT